MRPRDPPTRPGPRPPKPERRRGRRRAPATTTSLPCGSALARGGGASRLLMRARCRRGARRRIGRAPHFSAALGAAAKKWPGVAGPVPLWRLHERARVIDLLERAGPLEELGRLLAEAARGQGRMALLGGEAGVGKTSLVRRFTGAQPAGVRILWGGCDPLSLPRPLGPLLDVAGDL